MSISKILNTLENSWERNAILFKIKSGVDIDDIVDEFLIKNEEQVKKLNTLLKPEHIDLFNQVEQLSNCEAKLISKINNLNYLKDNENQQTIDEKKISLPNRFTTKKISLLMINWSNKFIVIALLTISAIALSKQAWA